MNVLVGIVLELIDRCWRLRDIESLFLVEVGKQPGDQVVLFEQLTSAFPFPVGLLNGGLGLGGSGLRAFNGLHTTGGQGCQAVDVFVDVFVQLGPFRRYNCVQGTFGPF